MGHRGSPLSPAPLPTLFLHSPVFPLPLSLVFVPHLSVLCLSLGQMHLLCPENLVLGSYADSGSFSFHITGKQTEAFRGRAELGNPPSLFAATSPSLSVPSLAICGPPWGGKHTSRWPAASQALYLHVGGVGDKVHRHPVLHILGPGVPKCSHIVGEGLASQQVLHLLCQKPTWDGACQPLGRTEMLMEGGADNLQDLPASILPSSPKMSSSSY